MKTTNANIRMQYQNDEENKHIAEVVEHCFFTLELGFVEKMKGISIVK